MRKRARVFVADDAARKYLLLVLFGPFADGGPERELVRA